MIPALSACTTGGGYNFENQPVIPVADIVNGIKCELNEFLRSDVVKQADVFAFNKEHYATIELKLKVVASHGVGTGSITPGVLPFGTVSVGPSFSFSRNQTRTLQTTTTFAMMQFADAAIDCANIVSLAEGMGLRIWLEEYFKEERMIVPGEPKIAVSHINLTSDFGVRQVGEAGFKLIFTLLSLAPSASATQEDVQSISITFRGQHPMNAVLYKRPDNPRERKEQSISSRAN
jgi:hypothetical protein